MKGLETQVRIMFYLKSSSTTTENLSDLWFRKLAVSTELRTYGFVKVWLNSSTQQHFLYVKSKFGISTFSSVTKLADSCHAYICIQHRFTNILPYPTLQKFFCTSFNTSLWDITKVAVICTQPICHNFTHYYRYPIFILYEFQKSRIIFVNA